MNMKRFEPMPILACWHQPCQGRPRQGWKQQRNQPTWIWSTRSCSWLCRSIFLDPWPDPGCWRSADRRWWWSWRPSAGRPPAPPACRSCRSPWTSDRLALASLENISSTFQKSAYGRQDDLSLMFNKFTSGNDWMPIKEKQNIFRLSPIWSPN